MITGALAVARKELRQIRRDRRTLLILLFVPALFLLLYGYALSFDVRRVRLAVEDRDRSPESRELAAAFVESGYFVPAAVVREHADVQRLLDSGKALLVLVVPEGFSRRLREGSPAAVQILVDGSNAGTASTVIGYALSIVRSASERHRPAAAPPVTAEPRVWYNPELRSTIFLVPGLVAYIMMLTAVVSTALSIVREKERGTLEQIRMAPIGTAPYILGKSLPYLVLSFAAAILIVLVSMALFDLPMRGSWVLLCLLLALFLAGALATGLLVSTVAASQQVAFQIAALVAYLPTLVLSGFIFPISSMPQPVQWLTYVVPARYFVAALRGLLLKGAGADVLAPSLAALGAYAAAMGALAAVRLRHEAAA
ncbi:MAG TPA: ABC transporter permease [Vicinamibacterales bacterium]|nr:ABC transporter permease [Vicinamibacterales bacterium]